MASSGPSTKEMLLDAVEQTAGSGFLETIEPHDATTPSNGAAVPDGTDPPTCITQHPIPRALLEAQAKGGLTDIVVGLDSNVPRWVPGSVVKWAAWRQGFANQEDANYAAEQLQIAAEAWNKAEVGVTFEWVPLAKDATFVLVHGGALGGVLASAFFPNSNDLNFLNVYSTAFTRAWKPNMWKIFTHELGHVLGLRHEFAIGDAESEHAAEQAGGVRIDAPDPLSVMNYRREAPEMQQSDIVSTRKFYQYENGAYVGWSPIVDYTPR